jgi:hypothetical protein
MTVCFTLIVVILLTVLSLKFGAVTSYQFNSYKIKMSGNLYRSSEHLLYGFRIVSSEIEDGVMWKSQRH